MPVPSAVPESGGDVTFTFGVTNTAAGAVVIDQLTDSVFGPLAGQGNCAIGQTVAPGQTYGCTVVRRLSGSASVPHRNTFTVTATTVEEEVDAIAAATDGFLVESAAAAATLTARADATVTFIATAPAPGVGLAPSVPGPTAPTAPNSADPSGGAVPAPSVPTAPGGALAHTGSSNTFPVVLALMLLGLGATHLGTSRRSEVGEDARPRTKN